MCMCSADGRWDRCSPASAGPSMRGLPSRRQPLGFAPRVDSEGRMMATIAPRGGLLLGRVKSLDAILATAEKKGLHRSLGAFQLTLLGIGAVIGTGIFVLTAEAAQKAGPAMTISFIIAGTVCAVAALCYSELASMVPVAGSAYTYTYAVMGELFAWMVGWALILEYAIGASAVAVGWSGYFVGLMKSWGIIVPPALAAGPFGVCVFTLPAAVIAGLVTILLIIGTKESARFNAVLVLVKVTALTVFCLLTLPVLKGEHFHPFIPNGWGTYGVVGAAASIFFAYVGFDAVSTAAEETKKPQRTVGYQRLGDLMGIAAFIALPSVVLMMMFGQTRIFFVMARDGLLPDKLASVHPRFRTPHVVTAVTGVGVMLAAAFLPVGKLADYSHSGTLFAFMMVAISVLVLRRTDPNRRRPFRTPAVGVIAPIAIIGCVALYIMLPPIAIAVLPVWGAG